jgi:hypothetical protein
VLEDDAGENGIPCGSDRVGITAVGPLHLEGGDDLLVREVIEDQLKAIQVRICINVLPGEEVWL